ncbi:MAG: cell division protein [Euryarchaeota archaeon]|nr:cell division protein [Euryarchaeota archaeon]
MKVFVIGFGQAGGKIADLFLEYQLKTGTNSLVRALVINSAQADLMGLKYVPMEDRLLIGQAIAKGHGVGADNELGAKIAADDIYTIQSAIDRRGTHKVDAFLIIAGLGGGTGSGGCPVLARRLKKLYTEPVYALGVLPSNDEGALYSLNAARSLMTLVKEVDNLFLFDNDAWKIEGTTLKESYASMNEELARRFGIVLGAGEQTQAGRVGEKVVDASEIINTLSTGGISSIGYAREELSGPKGMGGGLFKKKRTSMDSLDSTTRIVSLVRRAVMGRLTIPCDVTTAEKALVLVAGPPEHLDRKGVEKARIWIEELIEGTEVRGGDYPVPNSKFVADVVVLSGVSDIPRIKELQKQAIEAQEKIKEFATKKDKKITELLSTEESLKPLF